MSWPLVAIKDVARVVTGKTPSTADSDNFGGDIPFITPSELGLEAYVTASPRTLSDKGAAEIKLVPKNSVMVCCIGSLGKLAIAGTAVATNQQINSVIFDANKVDAKYGFYALQLLKPKMESMAPSTTVAIINKSNFEALQIPLPPLPEQKRIAAILDKADAIRRKRQQAIQLADDFLRAVFLDMFGDPVTNPKGWEITYMTSHGSFKNGLNFGKGEVGNSLRYLGVGDFKSLSTIDDVCSLGSVELDTLPAKDYLLENGDLVFVRSNGNKALVGRCITVYPNGEPLTFSGFCIRYRVENDDVESEYLNYLFRTPSMKQAMLKGGQGANIQNINQKILAALEIPLPPKALQEKFSKIVRVYRDSKLHVDCSFADAESLFAAISQKAFSGEL